MTTESVERWIRNAHFVMLFGMALYAVGTWTPFYPGVFAGVLFTYFGACAATLMEWKSEPGLWMLALVELAMPLCIYIPGTMGGGVVTLMLAVGFILISTVLAFLIRFLLSVAYRNYRISQAIAAAGPD
jgi:hypothetical protein